MIKNNSIKHFNNIIVCAALANYTPKKQKGKISSGKENLSIICVQSPTILDALRLQAPRIKIIAYKTEEKKINVKKQTQQLLTKHHLDGAIGNTIAGFGVTDNEIFILKKNGKSSWKKGKKEELAPFILDMIK
jgi:phosphopantothenoylcysteine synthetase/decarboxylase